MTPIKLAFFRTLGKLRRWLPLLRRQSVLFTAVQVDDIPDKLESGKVYLVGENNHFWSAALKCPGGGGNVLEINLVPDTRPLWRVTENSRGLVTVEPSIWRRRDCECHFRITDGKVSWY